MMMTTIRLSVLTALIMVHKVSHALHLPKGSEEFLRSMQRIEERQQRQQQHTLLQRKLLQAAEKVTPEILRHWDEQRELANNNNNNYYYANQNSNNNNNNNNNNQYNYGGNRNNGNINYQNYEQAYNQNKYNYQQQQNYQYNGNQNGGNENYYKEYKQYDGGYSSNADLTELSLKYVGCQNIHTWSDSQAKEGDSPLVMKRYVMLRLCETDQCSAYNKWGCNYNYGEYVLPMETYLSIMSNFHFEQYNRYCETCKACKTFDFSPYAKYLKSYGYQNSNGQNNNGYNGNFRNSNTANQYGYDQYSQQYNNGASNEAFSYGDYSDPGNDEDAGWYIWTYGYGFMGYNGDDQISAPDDDNSSQSDNDDAYRNRNLANDNYYRNGNNYGYNNGGGNYGYQNNNVNQYNGNYGGQNYGYQNGNNGHNNGGYYNGGYSQPVQLKLPWYVDQWGECIFDSVCENYKSVCRSYSPNATFYQDYFSCTQFSLGNQMGYLGPHCRQDGHTIGIGIYGDEQCNTYIGDVTDLNMYTAKQFDDSELSPFYDKTCISCRSSNSYSLIEDGNNGNDATYPLCGAIYQNSAKCHESLGSISLSDASDDSDSGKVCPFIQSLEENNYDESGEIHLYDGFRLSNWMSPQEYRKFVDKASPIQILGLVASIGAFLSLLTYAVHLQRKLLLRKPWRPPKHVNDPITGVTGDYILESRSEAGRLSRVNSGIAQMRSRSYDGQSQMGNSKSGSFAPEATVMHGDLSYRNNPKRIQDPVSRSRMNDVSQGFFA